MHKGRFLLLGLLLAFACQQLEGCAAAIARGLADSPYPVVASVEAPAPAPVAVAPLPQALPWPAAAAEPPRADVGAVAAVPTEPAAGLPSPRPRSRRAGAVHPPAEDKPPAPAPTGAGPHADLVGAGDVTFWAEPETETVQSHVFLDCTPKGVAAEAIPASAATAAIPDVRFSHVIVAELHADKKDFDIPNPVQKAVILGTEVARLTWDVTPVGHVHGKSDPDETRRIWVTVSPTTQVGNDLIPDTTFEKDSYISVKILHAPPPPWWKPMLDWYLANADSVNKACAGVAGALGAAWAWMARRRKDRIQAPRERHAAEAVEDESPLPSILPPAQPGEVGTHA